LNEVTPEAFGVTPDFVDFIRGLTPETFVEYPKPSLDSEWAMTQWQGWRFARHVILQSKQGHDTRPVVLDVCFIV
jgi:hypothetical protein